MEILFKVIRQQHNSSPIVQTYLLDVEPGNTILDCLNRIKWEQDGTLAYRKNCRNTICGSCAMRINGRSALACKENVGSEIARLQKNPSPARQGNTIPEITIAPLGNMPVIKDLVVDMSSFWNNLEAVTPYVSTAARQVPEREFLQTPQERSRLDQTENFCKHHKSDRASIKLGIFANTTRAIAPRSNWQLYYVWSLLL